VIGRPIFTGFDSFFEASIFGIIFGWPKRHDNGVCGTHIDSQVFDLNRAYADSSVIRRRGFLPCGDGQKNDLRPVRLVGHGLVRPSRASNARSSQQSDAHLPALRDTAHLLPPVRRGERLDFLADNPFYTKRFAYYVGRRCRDSAIKEIAEELLLDWDTVKELDRQYMQAQLARAGTPGPKVIGIDEISIRKGHTYRIVVSDLLRQRQT
jgi:hypothetical protein